MVGVYLFFVDFQRFHVVAHDFQLFFQLLNFAVMARSDEEEEEWREENIKRGVEV